MKGCPLECLWCDNPESQRKIPEIVEFEERCIGCRECKRICPSGAITQTRWKIRRDVCTGCGKCAEICPAKARELSGKVLTVKEVMKEIEKDVIIYRVSGGGVTVSGGEPGMQISFVCELLEGCQQRGINTAVETSGYMSWNNLLKIVQFADLVLYDLKCMDSIKHKLFTGVPNRLILENARKIAKENKAIIIRVPIISTYNDDLENIRELAEFVKDLGTNIREIHLLPYHGLGVSKFKRLGREYQLKNIKSPAKDHIEKLRGLLDSYGLRVQVGG